MTSDMPASTSEQHDERIVELRARRRKRLRWLALRGGVATAALVVAVVAFAYWLLTSIGGRELLLAELVQRLPDNATLTWKRVEGPARGPLTLHDVRFSFVPACPPAPEACVPRDPVVFNARQLTLDFALRPLLGRRLQLDALHVTDASLLLSSSPEPFKLPTWPEVLPDIAPPLALRADDVRVDRLHVYQDRKSLIDVRSVRGGVVAESGLLHLERLRVDSDRGRFTAHGDYVPREQYRSDLVATAVFPIASAPQRTPLRLGFVAKGDLSRMDVAVAGALPGPVRATLTLRGAEIPRWQLRAHADGIDTALLAGARKPSTTPLSLRAQADGVGGRASLSGQFDQGELHARVLPSQLMLQDQVLEFSPLVMRVFDGEVVVRGRGDFNAASQARIRYAINARGLRWGGEVATPATARVRATSATPSIVADADFGIAGTQAAWAVIGDARLHRDGDTATVSVDGRGHGAELTLRSLQARMPTGTLQAQGTLGWLPEARWKLDATLAGFDPGYFAPGWAGAINGAISSHGRARDPQSDGSGGFDGAVSVSRLGGQLRGRTLSGSAHLDLRGDDYDARLALGIGQARLEAEGSFGTAARLHWDGRASLRAFDPGFFADGWDGAVDARLRSRGKALPAGGYDANLDVTALGGQLRGRALAGSGNASVLGDAYRGEVDLRIGQSRVEARGRFTQTLDIQAQLTPLDLNDLLPDAAGTLRGTLNLSGPRTSPDVAADLQGQGLRWGELRADSLLARGRLPWRNGSGALDLRASGLQAGVPFESLSIDARGAVENLQLDAQARGGIGALALRGHARKQGATWQGALASLALTPTRGAAWQLQQPATFHWDGRNGALSRSCLQASGGGALCASADWPRRGLDVNAQGLPLALLQPYLPEREDRRPWLLSGVVDFDGELRAVGNAWRGQATLTSARGGLKFSERARSELVRYSGLSLRTTFDPQRLQAELGATLNDDGRIDARIVTGWDGYAPLTGDIALDTDELTWMELFSPDIVDPKGRLSGRIALSGTRAQPLLGGQARLSGFTTELPALALSLQQGEATLDALPDGSARITGKLRSGDGTLDINGTLGWRGTDTPLVLKLSGDNVLLSDTRDLHAVASPDVTLRYAVGQPFEVTGTVTVPEARIDLERLDQGVSASPDVVVLDPINTERNASTPLQMDLTLALGDDVSLKGFGLDGQLSGRLRVLARPGREMVASGALEVDGRYRAYGQRLDITQGEMLWNNSPIADPLLNLRAEREVGAVTAGVRVSGRASAPQASVWSDPATSQSEALSYLALGRPLSSITGDEGKQLDAASAALSAGGSLLASQLGARIGLDDAGVMESRALGSSVVGIGKHLSPRLYVSYGVALAGNAQVLTLKYLLRRGFDIEIESSSIENRGSLNWRLER